MAQAVDAGNRGEDGGTPEAVPHAAPGTGCPPAWAADGATLRAPLRSGPAAGARLAAGLGRPLP